MNNAINYAISQVKQQVPYQILDLVFVKKNMHRFAVLRPITLDQSLIDTIVIGIVRKDCNLVGGRPMQTALQQTWHEATLQTMSHINSGSGPYSIYRIPEEERLSCPITEVMHAQYPQPYGNGESYGRNYGGGTICDAAKALLDSHTGGGAPRPIVELLQGDLVRLHPGGYSHVDWVITYKVAYDENMTNLNSSAIRSFARLAVLATKRYIYNQLIIDIDRGFIEGGAEIPMIRQIVESWNGLDQDYQEELNKYFGANVLDVTTAAVVLKYML
jgi:hypothetical protein